MTFLGLEARTDLPKVPYPTALDFFVFLSFAFIFATIIQFAVVHYFTKYGSGECYFSSDLSDTESSSEEEDVTRRLIKNQPVNIYSKQEILHFYIFSCFSRTNVNAETCSSNQRNLNKKGQENNISTD